MKNPDFVAIAKAYGIPAWRATTYAEAEAAIAEARKVDGPALITFIVDAEEHVFPMVPPNTSLRDQVLSEEHMNSKTKLELAQTDAIQGASEACDQGVLIYSAEANERSNAEVHRISKL